MGGQNDSLDYFAYRGLSVSRSTSPIKLIPYNTAFAVLFCPVDTTEWGGKIGVRNVFNETNMAELTLEQFNEAIAKLATKDDIRNMVVKDDIKNMATKDDLVVIRSEMATKDDLVGMATKDDLKTLQKGLEEYVDDVAGTILDSLDTNFQQIRRRLDMRDHRLNKVDSEVKELKTALNLS